MKDFNWSNLFKISLDVNLTVSLVLAWIIKCFAYFRMIGSAWCRKLSTAAPGNFLTLTDRLFDKFLSITPFKIESPSKTQVFGGWVSGFSADFFFSECSLLYYLNWTSFCNFTSRSCSSIEILGMTLIDLPLSEVVVVSEVVNNMSHCGGARCVFFGLGVSESLLQLLFVVVVLQLL